MEPCPRRRVWSVHPVPWIRGGRGRPEGKLRQRVGGGSTCVHTCACVCTGVGQVQGPVQGGAGNRKTPLPPAGPVTCGWVRGPLGWIQARPSGITDPFAVQAPNPLHFGNPVPPQRQGTSSSALPSRFGTSASVELPQGPLLSHGWRGWTQTRPPQQEPLAEPNAPFWKRLLQTSALG